MQRRVNKRGGLYITQPAKRPALQWFTLSCLLPAFSLLVLGGIFATDPTLGRAAMGLGALDKPLDDTFVMPKVTTRRLSHQTVVFKRLKTDSTVLAPCFVERLDQLFLLNEPVDANAQSCAQFFELTI